MWSCGYTSRHPMWSCGYTVVILYGPVDIQVVILCDPVDIQVVILYGPVDIQVVILFTNTANKSLPTFLLCSINNVVSICGAPPLAAIIHIKFI